MACSSNDIKQGAAEQVGVSKSAAVAAPDSTPVGDSADPTELTLEWKETMGGGVKTGSDSLTVELTNTTDRPQTGRLSLMGTGLDGRVAWRQMGSFSLAANEKANLAVPVSALPVQAEVATSMAVLQAEIDRPDAIMRPHTRPLYYIFSNGYAQVELYSEVEALKLVNGGLRTSDPMDVRGLVWDDTKSAMQAIDMKATADPTQPRQGLAMRTTSPPTLSAASSGGAAPMSGNAYVKFCGYWYVSYMDGGFGEDVWNTNAFMWQPAPYASAEVWDSSNNTWWSGHLNQSGCTPWIPTYSYYLLYFGYWTWDNCDYTGGRSICFHNVLGYSPYYPSGIQISHYSGASGSMETIYAQVGYNDDAIQTAAITDKMLLLNKARLDASLDALLPNSATYWIYANYAGPDPVMSYCGGDGNVYIGTQSGGGVFPGSWWKFIVGHEIGHCTQLRQMGYLTNGLGGSDYDDGNEPAPPNGKYVCRCDNVYSPDPPYYIAKKHCLNSRELSRVAQYEGFAHFFATKVWNNDTQADATFVYYKRFQNSETSFTEPPMAKNGFDPIKWLETTPGTGTSPPGCKTPWSGLGVEFDWLTFFYNVTSRDSGRAATRTTLPDLYNIYELACGGTCTNTTAPTGVQLYNAACTYFVSHSRLTAWYRFRDTMTAHGVFH
jgi:hypothetical protein